MMGFALPRLDVPVVKASNCVIATSPALFPPAPPEMPCIRCGACARACPAELQPFELYWHSRARNFGKTQEYHIFDCIECGCCSFVCPSRIRLVDYFRFAKSSIRAREREKAAADEARVALRIPPRPRGAREGREGRQARRQGGRDQGQARGAGRNARSAKSRLLAGRRKTRRPRRLTPRRRSSLPRSRARQRRRPSSSRRTSSNLTPETQAEIGEIESRRAQVREIAKTPPEEPV